MGLGSRVEGVGFRASCCEVEPYLFLIGGLRSVHPVGVPECPPMLLMCCVCVVGASELKWWFWVQPYYTQDGNVTQETVPVVQAFCMRFGMAKTLHARPTHILINIKTRAHLLRIPYIALWLETHGFNAATPLACLQLAPTLLPKKAYDQIIPKYQSATPGSKVQSLALY